MGIMPREALWRRFCSSSRRSGAQTSSPPPLGPALHGSHGSLFLLIPKFIQAQKCSNYFLEIVPWQCLPMLLDVDGMLRHSMFQSYNWQWLAFQVADTDTLEPNVTVGWCLAWRSWCLCAQWSTALLCGRVIMAIDNGLPRYLADRQFGACVSCVKTCKPIAGPP